MIDLLKKTIDALKYKVNSNLEEIKTNEAKFRNILTEKKTTKKQDELNKILERNKNLLSENFDFINIQVTLLKFVEKYRYHEIIQKVQNIQNTSYDEQDITEYFELTIEGSFHFLLFIHFTTIAISLTD